MNPWRDMALDAGMHHDTGMTLDQAAAWLERQAYEEQERLAYEEWVNQNRPQEGGGGMSLPDIVGFDRAVDRITVEFGGELRCESCGYRRTPEGRYWREGWPVCHGASMRWWTQRQIDAGEMP